MRTLMAGLVLLASATGVAGAAPAAPRVEATGPQATYWQRAKDGWFWQIDPPEPEAGPPAPPPADRVAPASPDESDLKAFEAFKAQLEQAMNVATQNPSDANVARFLELYAQARRRASEFSDKAQAISVRMPWIDPTFSGARPTIPTAQRAYDSIQIQDRDQLLREMSKSYGLFFFFRRNCAYCHIQAPMLKQFQVKYGFTVYAVTLDGGGLPDFPSPVQDNGLLDQVAAAVGMPVDQFVVPAVVLARPASNEVVPVGFGAMTMDQMADRLAMVVRVQTDGPGRTSRTALSALTGQEPAPPGAPRSRVDAGR